MRAERLGPARECGPKIPALTRPAATLLSAVARGQWKGTKLSEGPDTTGQTNHVEHAKSKPRRFIYDLLLQQPTGPTISLVLMYRALCLGLFMTRAGNPSHENTGILELQETITMIRKLGRQ